MVYFRWFLSININKPALKLDCAALIFPLLLVLEALMAANIPAAATNVSVADIKVVGFIQKKEKVQEKSSTSHFIFIQVTSTSCYILFKSSLGLRIDVN